MRIAIVITVWLAVNVFVVSVWAHDIAFSNCSTNELYVNDVLFDGKDSGVPVGILVPEATATAFELFPKKVPAKITIQYRIGSKSFSEDISGKEVIELLKHARGAARVRVYFVYAVQGRFIPKVETQKRRGWNPGDQNVWPDQNAPMFQKYKSLIRAAYAGNAREVRKELQGGVPFVWPDHPMEISPLEFVAGKGHDLAFDELITFLPVDYSPYKFGNCIKVAAQNENISILKKLLMKPAADRIPPRLIQDIFYSASSSAKAPTALEILLNRYPVGIDFRVRDYGHTLLISAVQGRRHEIAEWLVRNGANKTLALQNGSKAIDWARDERMRQLLALP